MSRMPFATYASSSNDSDSQPPLFFSFTDAASSRAVQELNELDELDDDRDNAGRPYLRGGNEYSGTQPILLDDNPYLRLDEEDLSSQLSHSEALPMSLSPKHIATDEPLESQSTSSSSAQSSPRPAFNQIPPPPATNNSLTESLLPRDGLVHSVFSLPEPGRVPRHKYNDSVWTILWLFSLILCGIGFLFTLILTHMPTDIPSDPSPLPYSTLIHAVPFLTAMTTLSIGLAYFLLLALQYAVYPILQCISVIIPLVLVISSLWAFSSSFIWDGQDGTWGETVGLRLYSLVPLGVSLLFAYSLHKRRHFFAQTARVTELSIRLIRMHQPLLFLSPSILFVSLILSLPFLSLLFRLLLIGSLVPTDKNGTLIWHLRAYAGWLITGVLSVWFWSWFVACGIVRSICASVIGAWYFKGRTFQDPSLTMRFALERAKGPTLGTICLASLVLSITQSILFSLRLLRRLTALPLVPAFLHPFNVAISFSQSCLSTVSNYTLVYVGLTGEPFFRACQRSRVITSVKRLGLVNRHYTLLSTLLSMMAFVFGSCLALATYIYTAHILRQPFHAPLSAFLAGIISFLVMLLCTSLVADVADTLYICYCIDKEIGARHSEEVFVAFEGRRPANVRV